MFNFHKKKMHLIRDNNGKFVIYGREDQQNKKKKIGFRWLIYETIMV